MGGPGGAERVRDARPGSVPSPDRRHRCRCERKAPPVIRDQLTDALQAALVALEVEPLPESINLERPARREHGDWSSNVALATGKRAGRNPRELAQQLAD